ncbi:MAG: hypothetical protein U0232_15035 [Thermomicrobiales bacterium]
MTNENGPHPAAAAAPLSREERGGGATDVCGPLWQIDGVMTGDEQTPDAIYAGRRERFAREAAALEARWNRVANLRLAAFLVAVACLGWGVRVRLWPLVGVGGLLLVAFLVLVRHHVMLGRARRRALEFVAIAVEAAARRRRDWEALPLRSAYRAGGEHPYAADLDVFGRASLFHLLYPGGTALGERTLREWLLAAAAPGWRASGSGQSRSLRRASICGMTSSRVGG